MIVRLQPISWQCEHSDRAPGVEMWCCKTSMVLLRMLMMVKLFSKRHVEWNFTPIICDLIVLLLGCLYLA
ncbi:hypothetical protein HanRHA438_Chr01g0010121 [Helianthus annuus]|nr:hypothetical protein HanIR_Chr01g0010891 [Helianthus annuus]KAJ0946984.1 hypothetical protein HanRHA438_Chr01g0010121 [Helianthus annuus]